MQHTVGAAWVQSLVVHTSYSSTICISVRIAAHVAVLSLVNMLTHQKTVEGLATARSTRHCESLRSHCCTNAQVCNHAQHCEVKRSCATMHLAEVVSDPQADAHQDSARHFCSAQNMARTREGATADGQMHGELPRSRRQELVRARK